jgi:hypothetical protein
MDRMNTFYENENENENEESEYEKDDEFSGGVGFKKKNKLMESENTRFQEQNLYLRALLEVKVILLPMEISINRTEVNIKKKIVAQVEGKCNREGYVKPNSVNIVRYSPGLVKNEYIEFSVVFECKVCNPPEGTKLFDCICTSITKGGIHANVMDQHGNIPATVYIYRDHFTENRYFNSIKEKDKFHIKVIGVRFELNDPCVEIVGKLTE